MVKSKFKTEIGNDFQIERYEEHTVIGPMKIYLHDDNEDKKESEGEGMTNREIDQHNIYVFCWVCLLFSLIVCILSIIQTFIN